MRYPGPEARFYIIVVMLAVILVAAIATWVVSHFIRRLMQENKVLLEALVQHRAIDAIEMAAIMASDKGQKESGSFMRKTR